MRKAVRAVVVHDGNLLVIHRNKFGQEYYTLPGGGIDPGESAEQALMREMEEETGIRVKIERLIYVEEAGNPFGTQYVYLCTFLGGEPALHPDSDEALINALGQNTYTPKWAPLSEVTSMEFRSTELRDKLVRDAAAGFREKVETF
jgi:ADP-ribose pyrophosphatase YjhB (NUDIX family)